MINTCLRLAAILAIAVGLSGCASVSDTTARVPEHVPEPSNGLLASVPSKAITVLPFSTFQVSNVPAGVIGERTAFGGGTMGMVTVSPAPEVLFTDAIAAELKAAGHNTSGGPSTVSGVVKRFALTTPATATHWDVTIEADVEVTVNGVRRRYTDTCVTRTAAWPSDGLIAQVAGACVSRIATRFRQDRAVVSAL